MNTLIAQPWAEYELIDTGNRERLERFGPYLIVRPEPNCLWEPSAPTHPGWAKPDLRYLGKVGTEPWQGEATLLSGWKLHYDTLVFKVKPTPFRHMGLFPEQAPQWEWVRERVAERVKSGQRPRVLNLFAYTGAATLAAAQAGAQVCHVDASAGSLNWAKENALLSGLPPDAVRWIVDDVLKFVLREGRRESRYDLILMDPPVFGRGPRGEIWRLEEQLPRLIRAATALLTDQPLGFLLNFYATALYPESVARVVSDSLSSMFDHLDLGELLLAESVSKKSLPTGFFLRT